MVLAYNQSKYFIKKTDGHIFNRSLLIDAKVDGRQETEDRRYETGEGRYETGDRRYETGDGRYET